MKAKDTVMIWKQIVECSHNPVLELRESDICQAHAEISFKAGEDEEAGNILKCIKDAKRVHPDWRMDDIIELLEFRVETRKVMRAKGKPSSNLGA